MTNTEFSRNLRKVVSDQQIEIRALSRQSGVSEEAIHAWLRGDASPRLEMAGYVLEALGYKFEVVKCHQ